VCGSNGTGATISSTFSVVHEVGRFLRSLFLPVAVSPVVNSKHNLTRDELPRTSKTMKFSTVAAVSYLSAASGFVPSIPYPSRRAPFRAVAPVAADDIATAASADTVGLSLQTSEDVLPTSPPMAGAAAGVADTALNERAGPGAPKATSTLLAAATTNLSDAPSGVQADKTKRKIKP
jgi:hypothetical protein